MRKLLDIMFSNKKLSIIIPMCINIVMLLLCILFADPASKLDTLLNALLISTFCFFGIYFLLLIQVKNTSCPDWFLNSFEILVTFVTGIYAIIGTINFFLTGFKIFDFSICFGLVAYSATAWAHSKRR